MVKTGHGPCTQSTRLFGSYRLRPNPNEIQLGLTEEDSEPSWRTVVGVLSRPFKHRSP